MKPSHVDPWRVMVCGAEHPSGERIFILRGMPGKYQVTPAMPEELEWIKKNRRKFHGFLADIVAPKAKPAAKSKPAKARKAAPKKSKPAKAATPAKPKTDTEKPAA